MVENKAFLAMSGVQFVLVIYFLLKFYNEVQATQSVSTMFAGVIFGFIALGSLVFNLWLYNRPSIPLQGFAPIDYTRTVPWIVGGLIGIYGLSLFTSYQGGASVVFDLAQIRPAEVLSSTQPALSSLYDLVLWNFVVASSEEAFKLGLTNIMAMYIDNWFNSYLLGVKNSVWISAIIIITIWTGLHELNAFTASYSLIMAWAAGFFLLALIIKFQNMIPSVITHWFWNLVASVG